MLTRARLTLVTSGLLILGILLVPSTVPVRGGYGPSLTGKVTYDTYIIQGTTSGTGLAGTGQISILTFALVSPTTVFGFGLFNGSLTSSQPVPSFLHVFGYYRWQQAQQTSNSCVPDLTGQIIAGTFTGQKVTLTTLSNDCTPGWHTATITFTIGSLNTPLYKGQGTGRFFVTQIVTIQRE